MSALCQKDLVPDLASMYKELAEEDRNDECLRARARLQARQAAAPPPPPPPRYEQRQSAASSGGQLRDITIRVIGQPRNAFQRAKNAIIKAFRRVAGGLYQPM